MHTLLPVECIGLRTPFCDSTEPCGSIQTPSLGTQGPLWLRPDSAQLCGLPFHQQLPLLPTHLSACPEVQMCLFAQSCFPFAFILPTPSVRTQVICQHRGGSAGSLFMLRVLVSPATGVGVCQSLHRKALLTTKVFNILSREGKSILYTYP